MGPLRIIILAVLFYIGYRLLKGSFMKKSSPEESVDSGPGPSDRLTDVLVEDPVCHKLVPKTQAVCLHQNGEIIYFCSQECCNEFASEKGDTV